MLGTPNPFQTGRELPILPEGPSAASADSKCQPWPGHCGGLRDPLALAVLSLTPNLPPAASLPPHVLRPPGKSSFSYKAEPAPASGEVSQGFWGLQSRANLQWPLCASPPPPLKPLGTSPAWGCGKGPCAWLAVGILAGCPISPRDAESPGVPGVPDLPPGLLLGGLGGLGRWAGSGPAWMPISGPLSSPATCPHVAAPGKLHNGSLPPKVTQGMKFRLGIRTCEVVYLSPMKAKEKGGRGGVLGES